MGNSIYLGQARRAYGSKGARPLVLLQMVLHRQIVDGLYHVGGQYQQYSTSEFSSQDDGITGKSRHLLLV